MPESSSAPAPHNPAKTADTQAQTAENQHAPDAPQATVVNAKTEVIEENAQPNADHRPPYASPEWWLVAFTFGLMVYTAKLFRETKRLAKDAKRSGDRQANDTRAALAISRDAADAAKKSADATRAMLETERAWLLNSGFDSLMGANVTVNRVTYPIVLKINPTWKNDGKTPAIEVESTRAFKVLPSDSPTPVFETNWPSGTSRGVLGAAGIFNGPDLFIVGDDLTAVLNRMASVYLYCAVRYKDVFDANTTRMSATTLEIFRYGDHLDNFGKLVPNFIARQSDIAIAT